MGWISESLEFRLRSKSQRLIPHSSIHIHLLNFRDGSPYYPPPANVITWELPPEMQMPINHEMAITGSRVMITVSHLEENMPRDREVWRIAVWDWKTGDLVGLLWFD